MSYSHRRSDLRRTAGRWIKAASGLTIVTGPATESGVCLAAAPSRAGEVRTHIGKCSVHRLGALGTSMDMLLAANSPREADRCEGRVLEEIQRLSAILSTYDPASEISRFMRGGTANSAELNQLLDLYRVWQERTGSAVHINMAGVKALWKSAAIIGRLPDALALQKAFASPGALNVDALGKAFIIDRLVEIARQMVPAGVLDIGGDIRVWGNRFWPVAVADPDRSADNAPAIAHLDLRNAAVATSGSYARYMMVAGQRYSHIIDPRTLQPAPVENAASVVASDCVTANALSTAACVLPLDGAVALAQAYGSSYLIADAETVRSSGVSASQPSKRRAATSRPSGPPAKSQPAAAGQSRVWPEGYQARVEIALSSISTKKYKRPYIAVWIENEKKKVVRNLTVWGTKPKYLPELSSWWQAIEGDGDLARSITRATRSPGRYELVWDGRDDAGRKVPQGTYRIWIEINREHGRHTRQSVSLICGEKDSSVTVPATAESEESTIKYARREEK